MFYLITCVGAGLMGRRMGRTGSGWSRIVLSALLSGALGLAVATTFVLILASMVGIAPEANETIRALLKALGLGIFFGGLMARDSQFLRRNQTGRPDCL